MVYSFLRHRLVMIESRGSYTADMSDVETCVAEVVDVQQTSPADFLYLFDLHAGTIKRNTVISQPSSISSHRGDLAVTYIWYNNNNMILSAIRSRGAKSLVLGPRRFLSRRFKSHRLLARFQRLPPTPRAVLSFVSTEKSRMVDGWNNIITIHNISIYSAIANTALGISTPIPHPSSTRTGSGFSRSARAYSLSCLLVDTHIIFKHIPM